MRDKLFNCMVIIILVCAVISIPEQKETLKQVWEMSERKIVVLDPGHGGIDGGAEGRDGTKEKDLNLKIARKTKDLLEEDGIRVIMTRDSDEGLYEYDSRYSIRQLKSIDMNRRKEIIDEAEADLVVSIHMNSFSQDTSVRGAQVFYPPAGAGEETFGSRRAAKIIQANLNENINSDKKRTALCKEDVFIFREATSPIVITECGFLSNEEDLRRLKSAEYQEKISNSLKASICKYLGENGNNNQ